MSVDGKVPWHGWLWVPLGLLAMGMGVMHIFLDGGVALWDFKGTLSPTEGLMVVGIALIQVWWAVSFVAGSHGRTGGIISVAVLAFLWTGLTNGYPIVYCPPTCEEAYPLTDIAHLGAIVSGPMAGFAALWGAAVQWRHRTKAAWPLPLVAAVLAIATVVALANTPVN